METMITNYLNGNISTAKKQAEQFSLLAIRSELIETYGYTENKATLTAAHMKGEDCWQAACDAK